MRRFEVRTVDEETLIGEGVLFASGAAVLHVDQVPALVTYPSREVLEEKVATQPAWKVIWETVWAAPRDGGRQLTLG